MMDTTQMIAELRAYVGEFGASAATGVIAAICEEIQDANPRSEKGTLAAINASVLRDGMKRMVT